MLRLLDADSEQKASLSDWFGQGLMTAPSGTALRIGAETWTYSELYEVALRLGGAISADQCAARPVVGVLAARSLECYAGILGALFAGATVVPLSPAFPVERTAAMVRAAGVGQVLADHAGIAAARELRERVPGLRVVEPGSDGTVASSPLAEPVEVPSTAVAYVLFTSGSTGRPKGVPITHANMARFLVSAGRRYRLEPSDVCSQGFDTTFDLAMFDLFVTWAAGATLVSTPAQVFRSLPDFVAAHGLTVWFSVPSAIAFVGRLGGLDADSMPSLRWSLFCGEPLLAADASTWQAAAPRSTVENLYGPTELTIACSVYRWDEERSPGECVNGIVPIGDLYPGLDHQLLQDGAFNDVEGELCVTGRQMFPGYLDPAHDEGRFLTAEGRRWYRTGDLVRRVPAGLAFLDRVDRQIKIRGYRVEPAEVEARLREAPGVDDAVVVPVEHRGSRRLAAWYTGLDGCSEGLRGGLAGTVPEFMVPHWVRHLEAMPLNANRKIDRKGLAERAQRLADGGAT